MEKIGPRYLTIKEACRLLSISRNTCLAMIADGRPRAINLKRDGGIYNVWRVDATSIDDLSLREKIALKFSECRPGL